MELYGKLKDQKYLRHISCSIPWPVERSEASLQIINPSPPPPEMPSKIPTYSVFPNSDPDTEYEEDYETPAPGPPPTRSLALYTSWNQAQIWNHAFLAVQLVEEWQHSRHQTYIIHVVRQASSTGLHSPHHKFWFINIYKHFLSYFYVFGWKVLI